MTAESKKGFLPEEAKRCMIWCEDGGVPTVAHREWSIAASEAKRLSKLHPGKRFHLMQTKRIYSKPEQPVEVPGEPEQVPA